jgi:hypothetical protein
MPKLSKVIKDAVFGSVPVKDLSRGLQTILRPEQYGCSTVTHLARRVQFVLPHKEGADDPEVTWPLDSRWREPRESKLTNNGSCTPTIVGAQEFAMRRHRRDARCLGSRPSR